MSKEFILKLIKKYASNYSTHRISGLDELIFEHNFDDLADELLDEINKIVNK